MMRQNKSYYINICQMNGEHGKSKRDKRNFVHPIGNRPWSQSKTVYKECHSPIEIDWCQKMEPQITLQITSVMSLIPVFENHLVLLSSNIFQPKKCWCTLAISLFFSLDPTHLLINISQKYILPTGKVLLSFSRHFNTNYYPRAHNSPGAQLSAQSNRVN